MLRSLFTKWNIFTIIAVIAFVTTVSVASAIPVPNHTDLKSNTTEYILKDEDGKRISNLSMQITTEDLVNGEYQYKVYLTKTSSEAAYLRMFVNISKQKDNKIYSLDDYNNPNIDYTVSFENFIDGESVAESYGYEEEFLSPVNFCWKYYNKKVTTTDPIQIFNKITFNNEIEEEFSYNINFSIEMVNVSEFNSSNQWLDKPINWLNIVNS